MIETDSVLQDTCAIGTRKTDKIDVDRQKMY